MPISSLTTETRETLEQLELDVSAVAERDIASPPTVGRSALKVCRAGEEPGEGNLSGLAFLSASIICRSVSSIMINGRCKTV